MQLMHLLFRVIIHDLGHDTMWALQEVYIRPSESFKNQSNKCYLICEELSVVVNASAYSVLYTGIIRAVMHGNYKV